jgi:hypothetical protein
VLVLYEFLYVVYQEDGGTTVPEKESALEEAGAMDAVLVNTHQVCFPSLLSMLIDWTIWNSH